MIEVKDYIDIVGQFYFFLDTEFGFKRANETIHGNVFYDVEFKSKKKIVSISYENIEDHLEIIVFILKNGKLPDYDDKTKTIHLSQLSVRILSKVDKKEICLNNEFFANFKAKDRFERELLKGAKELRLCLNHFEEIEHNEL